jgi:hypothetical protein
MIQVCDRHHPEQTGGREGGKAEIGAGAERPVAIAQENADVFSVLVGDRYIQLAVIVEVADGDRCVGSKSFRNYPFDIGIDTFGIKSDNSATWSSSPSGQKSPHRSLAAGGRL